MSTAARTTGNPASASFRHEALLYDGLDEFVTSTADFVRQGVRAGEPVLAVVNAEKIGLLREALGDDAEGVAFVDMAAVGGNPARIIPLWQDFVDAHADAGTSLRGIGEPIWPERTPEELDECRRHESLLNVAFADAPAWWLLCPYDVGKLPPEVLDEAERTHPGIRRSRDARPSPHFHVPSPFAGRLSPPSADVEGLAFSTGPLVALRRFVDQRAAVAGLVGARRHDLVLAVTELATNSARHGGGAGELAVWREQDRFVCEVRDSGRIEDPLVGRRRPRAMGLGGRGLWLVHQLCDLVQVRSSDEGTVVRVHMRVP